MESLGLFEGRRVILLQLAIVHGTCKVDIHGTYQGLVHQLLQTPTDKLCQSEVVSTVDL